MNEETYNRPVQIIIREDKPAFWDPDERIIYTQIGKPLDLAHELAHVKLGHEDSYSIISDMYEERDAWKEAIRKVDPEEIRINRIRQSLNSYVKTALTFGRNSPQYKLARKLADEVIEYAKKRKKEAR